MNVKVSLLVILAQSSCKTGRAMSSESVMTSQDSAGDARGKKLNCVVKSDGMAQLVEAATGGSYGALIPMSLCQKLRDNSKNDFVCSIENYRTDGFQQANLYQLGNPVAFGQDDSVEHCLIAVTESKPWIICAPSNGWSHLFVSKDVEFELSPPHIKDFDNCQKIVSHATQARFCQPVRADISTFARIISLSENDHPLHKEVMLLDECFKVQND